MHIGTGREGTLSRFWMVYGERQGAPTYKHDTREAAEAEAQRLAAQHPGIAFYVLKATSRAFAEPAKVVTETLSKNPQRPTDPDAAIPF